MGIIFKGIKDKIFYISSDLLLFQVYNKGTKKGGQYIDRDEAKDLIIMINGNEGYFTDARVNTALTYYATDKRGVVSDSMSKKGESFICQSASNF